MLKEAQKILNASNIILCFKDLTFPGYKMHNIKNVIIYNLSKHLMDKDICMWIPLGNNSNIQIVIS